MLLYFLGVFPDSIQAEIPPLYISPGLRHPYSFYSFFHQTFTAQHHSKETLEYFLRSNGKMVLETNSSYKTGFVVAVEFLLD